MKIKVPKNTKKGKIEKKNLKVNAVVDKCEIYILYVWVINIDTWNLLVTLKPLFNILRVQIIFKSVTVKFAIKSYNSKVS